MKRSIFFLLIIGWLTGCIGTDVIDDETVDEKLEITQESIALEMGNTFQLSANYFDQFGLPATPELSWESSETAVVTVDNNGLVTAVGPGQANVTARTGSVVSNMVLATVVANVDDIAEVTISTPSSTSLNAGETLQLTASALNISGDQVNDQQITWSVDNTSIATVDNTGLLTAISEGEVTVTASADGINSTPLTITVGSTTKTATFVGQSGYNAEGTAILREADNGDIILEFEDNFSTDFALGTFIYMANTTDGKAVRGGGLELEEIVKGGAASFNITSVDPDATLDKYRYVIVLCKPAGITFGFADFNP